VVGYIILEVREVTNVTLAQAFGTQGITFQNGVIQADRKEHLLSGRDFFVQSSFDFLLHPEAVNGIVGFRSYCCAFFDLRREMVYTFL
jgi:hypothetical protein